MTSANRSDKDEQAIADTTADELRRAARYIEAVGLDGVAQLSQLVFPLQIGGLKEFARPAPEDRAALEGIRRLTRHIEGATTELHAIASAVEAGLPVPPILLTPVRPYLEAYRAADPEEQLYLLRPPNEGVDDDEFTPVDVDDEEATA